MGKITPAEFARKEGITRARVSQLMQGILKSAIIRVPGKKRVLLDAQKATALFRAMADPAKRRGKGAYISREYTEARLQTMKYQTKILAAKIEEKKSKYVLKSIVRRKIEKAKIILSKHISALPKRMATRLAPEKIEMEVLRIYNDEARKFLSEIIADIDKAGL